MLYNNMPTYNWLVCVHLEFSVQFNIIYYFLSHLLDEINSFLIVVRYILHSPRELESSVWSVCFLLSVLFKFFFINYDTFISLLQVFRWLLNKELDFWEDASLSFLENQYLMRQESK
jgi:hypothetical protein